MEKHGIAVWGAADLTPFATPVDETGNGFPRTLAFALPRAPEIMAAIQNGPSPAYANAYVRANKWNEHP